MERLHIAFLGPVNSGKSTLINAICGQEVSMVSPIAGTTTDPVRKLAELPGLGPCVLIDTPGLDDVSILGEERKRLTLRVLEEADLVVLVGEMELTAVVPVIHYSQGESVESLLERLHKAAPKQEEPFLTGNLVKAGDCVLLVMPQDSQAPKGRLILPQVQVLRELLDRGCVPVCCTPESLPSALESLGKAPDLVITDSQVFARVNAAIPADCPLTSFSILLAGAKGDMAVFLEGAKAIDALKPGDRILIAEACTHVPDTEDIGRVKIPALLRQKVSCHSERSEESLQIDIAAGNDFPEDLSPYALIIHCGACVATRTLVQNRVKKALRAGVPITNYGIALAKLTGILDRVVSPRIRQ